MRRLSSRIIAGATALAIACVAMLVTGAVFREREWRFIGFSTETTTCDQGVFALHDACGASFPSIVNIRAVRLR